MLEIFRRKYKQFDLVFFCSCCSHYWLFLWSMVHISTSQQEAFYELIIKWTPLRYDKVCIWRLKQSGMELKHECQANQLTLSPVPTYYVLTWLWNLNLWLSNCFLELLVSLLFYWLQTTWLKKLKCNLLGWHLNWLQKLCGNIRKMS